MLQLMREGYSYIYPPLSIIRFSFIQLSEPEECRAKILVHFFYTAAQDSYAGSCIRESEALLMGYCVLQSIVDHRVYAPFKCFIPQKLSCVFIQHDVVDHLFT